MSSDNSPSNDSSPTQTRTANGLTDVDRRFRLFVNTVREYGIFVLDADGCIATWNEGSARVQGYRADQIIGQHMSRFFSPEDVERGVPERLRKLAEQQGSVESEGWRMRSDGSRFWARVSFTALRDEDGTLEGFGVVTHDLSERKRTEETLKELSWRLIDAQDRERKRISLSLVDSLSPVCAALITELHQARSRTAGEASQRIDKSLALAESLSRQLRTTSYLLSPPLLESDGLLVTLRAHLRGLAKQNGVKIDMDFPAQLERLPPPVAAALYHVVQEFLAACQPGDSGAEARITVMDGQLILQVGADGQRLSQEVLEQAKLGIGDLAVALAGMQARVARLGGRLDLDASDSLCWLTVTLPAPPRCVQFDGGSCAGPS